MTVDTKKVREMREKLRDEALSHYDRFVQHMASDQVLEDSLLSMAMEAKGKVAPLLAKVAALDEVLAMEDHTPSSVSTPSQRDNPFIMPPVKTREQLAAESKAEADAILNDETSGFISLS